MEKINKYNREITRTWNQPYTTRTQIKDKHSQTHMQGSYVCIRRIKMNPCSSSYTTNKCTYIRDHAYTENNKDTATRIENPTLTHHQLSAGNDKPTPGGRFTECWSVSLLTTLSRRRQQQKKKASPTFHFQKTIAQTGSQTSAAQFTSKMHTDYRYIIHALKPWYE